MTWTRRDFLKTSTGALAWLSLGGCSRETVVDVTVLRNGIVLPVDVPFSQHSALAIRGNRVLAVGDDDTVRQAAGRGGL